MSAQTPSQAMYAALGSGQLTRSELAKTCGLKQGTVQSALARGIERGHFTVTDRGRTAGGRPLPKLYARGHVPPPDKCLANARTALTEDHEIVLRQLAHGPLTVVELADLLDMTVRQTQRVIAFLRHTRKWLDMRSRYYSLSETGREAARQLDEREAFRAAE